MTPAISPRTQIAVQNYAERFLSMYAGPETLDLFSALADNKDNWRVGYNEVDDYYWTMPQTTSGLSILILGRSVICITGHDLQAISGQHLGYDGVELHEPPTKS